MIGERIKVLRKTLDLTQQTFCERIGVKRNTVAKYETGRGEPIDAVISLICREFNVNETWLRTGEGEMFVDEPATVLDALAAKYDLSRDARSLVEEFVNLKPDIQQSFVDYALKVARSIANEGDDSDAIPQPEPDATPLADKDISVPATAPDIMAELAELKRQNAEKDKQLQEFAARLAAMEEEDALGFLPDTGNLA